MSDASFNTSSSPEMTQEGYDRMLSAGLLMNCDINSSQSYISDKFMSYSSFLPQYTGQNDATVPVDLVVVEPNIENLNQNHDHNRKRRKDNRNEYLSAHKEARRRAQNRAAQQAFRDRKERYIKDLENRLEESEGKNAGLSQECESLKQENSCLEAELDILRKENSTTAGEQEHIARQDGYMDQESILDLLLFAAIY